jgi:hypothetical protein
MLLFMPPSPSKVQSFLWKRVVLRDDERHLHDARRATKMVFWCGGRRLVLFGLPFLVFLGGVI